MGKRIPHNKKWTPETIKEEALKYKTRSEFQKKCIGAYAAARKLGIFDKVCSHMPLNSLVGSTPHNKKWDEETIEQEALKYKTRSEFQKNSKAYAASLQLKIADSVCSHMNILWENKWNEETIKQEALKYKTRSEFQKKSRNAYKAAIRLNILDEVCSHMEVLRKDWSNIETIKQEALKYKTRSEFNKNNVSAYEAAVRLNILDQVCSHMPKNATIGSIPYNKKWNEESITKEALKHNTRSEFYNNSNGAYNAAKRLNILDEICSHMQKSINTSYSEQNLFDIIKQKYPKTQKLRDRKVKIEGKSYIQGLDIDIYVPELRKGIEFDGKYWHSVNGLKRSRIDWPEEDILNYHQIKDKYFLSKNIQIFHIKEQDWLKDQELCINKCLEFLNNKEIK